MRRFGVPQKVTTTSAAEAAANQSRRAKGSSRLTAIGRLGQPPGGRQLTLDRPGAVDRDRPQPAGLRDRRRQLVRLSPPPIPAWTTGTSMPRCSSRSVIGSEASAAPRCGREPAFASSSSPRAAAPTCRRSSTRCTGATGSRWSGSGPTSRGRGRWSGRARRGRRDRGLPRRRLRGPAGARRGDGRLGRSRAAPTWSSSPATCSCSANRSSPASAAAIVNIHPALLPAFPGPRRDRAGAGGGRARRPGSPSTSSTRGSTPGR